MERAVLLVPYDRVDAIYSCAAYAAAHGWPVVEVLHSWAEWVKVVCQGGAEVGVLPDWDTLPPYRTPRLVSASDWRPQALPDPSRPHWRR